MVELFGRDRLRHGDFSKPGLARKLGLFDATMLAMGGIVGSGIFMSSRNIFVSAWVGPQ